MPDCGLETGHAKAAQRGTKTGTRTLSQPLAPYTLFGSPSAHVCSSSGCLFFIWLFVYHLDAYFKLDSLPRQKGLEYVPRRSAIWEGSRDNGQCIRDTPCVYVCMTVLAVLLFSRAKQRANQTAYLSVSQRIWYSPQTDRNESRKSTCPIHKQNLHNQQNLQN